MNDVTANDSASAAAEDVGEGFSVGPGFRLHTLEVCNWGTFDSSNGQVHTVHPHGQSMLLVGKNGYGKSTLVDALLTLLVRPGVRNFNVASGGKKRERDERTYIKGAFNRNTDGDSDRIATQFLRPKPKQMTTLLATFVSAASGRTLTIAQVMYLKSADEEVQKIYCLAEEKKSIATDLANLGQPDGLLKVLRSRGFRATRKFVEYEHWFAKATGVREKAMAVFNQTVAVKDIQRLNDFIRAHMLDSPNWSDLVDDLLKHFNELTEAHNVLQRTAKQAELLEPVAKHGREYQRQQAVVNDVAALQNATELFFAQHILRLYEPELQRRELEHADLEQRVESLGRRKMDLDNEVASLRREIETAGGERLIELKGLIAQEAERASTKRRRRDQLANWLRDAELKLPIDTAEDFAFLRETITDIAADTKQELTASGDRLIALAAKRVPVAKQQQELQEELQFLERRRENIPSTMVELRSGLCDALGLPPSELPFAGELVAVNEADGEWEASIEKILRPFALSLLVPDRRYRAVSQYVEQTRLVAHGRGERLVYLRVGSRSHASELARHPHSLLGKLSFRDGHPLVSWVEAEITQRYDYRCCETLDDFQQVPGKAVTKQRHLKSGGVRHEKDDTDRATDSRNFVLGWDNAAKKRRLREAIKDLQQTLTQIDEQHARLTGEVETLRRREAALSRVVDVTSFDDIDFLQHEILRKSYETQRREIEEGSEAVKTLKRDLKRQELEQAKVGSQRDDTIKKQVKVEEGIRQAKLMLTNARNQRDHALDVGSSTDQERLQRTLSEKLPDDELTLASIHQQQQEEQAAQRVREREAVEARDADREQTLTAMAKFQSKFDLPDLDTTLDSLGSFLALEERIRREDLPRHEQRFKDNLNEKVVSDIGLFWNALKREKSTIINRIDVLNESLKTIDFRPGTYIQLEARETTNAEVVAFQQQLKDCIGDSERDDTAANEERYNRIRPLIDRLRDEGEANWRKRVVDVRQWFNFVANVIDRDDLTRVSSYDDSAGQSGGEKAKLAFTILVSAIAYQYDLDADNETTDRFAFVMVDEMFSKVDDQHAQFALDLFAKFGLQLLIVAPLDGKARVTEPYVGSYLLVDKDAASHSEICEITARRFRELDCESPANAETPRKPR